MKRLFLVAALIGIPSLDLAAETLSLDALLAQAHAQNPELIAARQSWKVKMEAITPAGSWPDPTVTYIDERFPPGVNGMPTESVYHLRVEQSIPFPGKLSNESEMKRHEALIAEADYRAKALEIEQEVRMRFYQLYLTDQKIDIAQHSVLLFKNSLATAQARMASNQTSAADVFMIQTELGRQENNDYAQSQQRVLIQNALNTLLHQPTDTPLGSAAPPTLKDLPTTLHELHRLTRENSPAYLNAIHELNHSRSESARERLAFAPDFGVMVERETAPEGPEGRQIGVSMSFPLWFWRPWAEMRGAKEHVLEATATAEWMQSQALESVTEEFTNVQLSLTQARRYQSDILPSALASLKTAQQQYASGQSDFIRLLEAFRLWIDTHNEYQEQLYDYGEHWSALARWVGVDLDQTATAPGTAPTEMKHD